MTQPTNLVAAAILLLLSPPITLVVLERIFEGAEFTEIERDERDGHLVSLMFEGVDSEGDRMLYEYYAFNHGGVNPVVRVIFHDSEGSPCGGYNIANYDDGVWKM